MYFPTIAVIDIRECGGNSTLRHHGVRFAKKRFTNQADANLHSRRLNRRTQSCAAGADYEDIVFEGFVVRHAFE